MKRPFQSTSDFHLTFNSLTSDKVRTLAAVGAVSVAGVASTTSMVDGCSSAIEVVFFSVAADASSAQIGNASTLVATVVSFTVGVSVGVINVVVVVVVVVVVGSGGGDVGVGAGVGAGCGVVGDAFGTWTAGVAFSFGEYCCCCGCWMVCC